MRALARALGFLLHVPALMAALSVPVALLAGEWYGVWGFALLLGAGLGLGQALIWCSREAPPLQRYQAMRVAAIGWIAISALGSLPFLVSAHLAPAGEREALAVFRGALPALFEATSGFTSTGLSMAPSAAALPAHLQWWRSFTEWVGGIGVILLLLTLLPVERSALHLYLSEAREEKILPSVRSTVRAMWLIFATYTVIAVLALMATGEPPWRALNHGMTAIATGGFSITDDSLAGSGRAAQWCYMVIMLAGAVSFTTHYRLLRGEGGWRLLRHSSELRVCAVLVFLGGALMLAERSGLGDGDAQAALLHWVSALTTTGFSAGSLAEWQGVPLLMLVVAMVIGGMSGSTAGGLKQHRVAVLFRDLAWNLHRYRLQSYEIVRVRFDGGRLRPEAFSAMARGAALLAMVWLLTWLIGVTLLLHALPAETPLSQAFFEAASAQGNVGLSVGITGAELPPLGLATLIVLMITGRLEIFPLLLVVAWLLRPGTR